MIKILLLGGGLQALSVGESLASDEYELSVVSDDLQILKSRAFKYHYPKSVCYSDALLCDFVKKGQYDVVIPMGDIAASLLSKYKNSIENSCSTKCAVPEYQLFSLVSNKSSFMHFCKENDIPHPKTYPLTAETLERAAQYTGFPALIKPDHSVGARGITKVLSEEDLLKNYFQISGRYGMCTLQEFIDNSDYYYNVMLYRSSNETVLAYTIIKIIRMYPVGGGSSSFCVSVENDELLNLCKRCLDKLNWVGIADFDVLQRKDNGEYKVIEINPRVPASLRAAYVSGINFPEVIVRDVMEEMVISTKYVPGKKLRYMGLDILWILKSPKRFKQLSSWLSFWNGDTYYQDILANDVSTWYTWLVVGIKKLINR